MNKDIYAEIRSELGKLKPQLFNLYFEDPEFKKYFLGDEIAFDFLFYSGLFRKYQIQPRGAIYLGGHKGELLLQFILLGFTDIIIVEPLPELFEQLQVKVDLINRLLDCYGHFLEEKPISSIEAVQCAVSNQDASAEFYVTADSYLGSLFKPKTKTFEEQELFADATVTNRLVVPTRTVDSIIKQSAKKFSDFNFLYINVQGAELKALEGAKETLDHVDYIYIENNLVSRYENSKSPEEVEHFIVEHNFVKLWEYLDRGWGVTFSLYAKNNA